MGLGQSASSSSVSDERFDSEDDEQTSSSEFPWETLKIKRKEAIQAMRSNRIKLRDMLVPANISLALQIVAHLDRESVGQVYRFDDADLDPSNKPSTGKKKLPRTLGVVTIWSHAKLRTEAEKNKNYQEWMAFIDQALGSVILDFAEQAGTLLSGESSLSVMLAVREALAAFQTTSPLQTQCLELLKTQVEKVRREHVMPLDDFVSPGLQRQTIAFLQTELLQLLRRQKSLNDIAPAVGQLLDGLAEQLRGVRPVRLGLQAGGKELSAREIRDIVEQVLLSTVAMFNYHGDDPSRELRTASDELQVIARRLHGMKADRPGLALALEIVAEYFVKAYCALLRLLVDDRSGVKEAMKLGQLEFSPRNVFFVLMSDFVHQLLMMLPPRLCKAHLRQNRMVLFDSKSLLENASRLLEAEDYFTCGDLRQHFERFLTDRIAPDAQMELLVSISAVQFWRVFKGTAKDKAMSRIRLLTAQALSSSIAPICPPSPDRLLFLLAAHRILHVYNDDNDGTKLLADTEHMIFSDLAVLTPSIIPAGSTLINFRAIFRSFVHLMITQRSHRLGAWPSAWDSEIAEFRQYIRRSTASSPASSSSSSSAFSADLSSTMTTALPALDSSAFNTADTRFEQLASAIEHEDLFIAAGLLPSTYRQATQASPEFDEENDADKEDAEVQILPPLPYNVELCRKFSTDVAEWVTDFLRLYRRRFDYICPFALSMEAYQLGPDGQEPLPPSIADQPENEEEADSSPFTDSALSISVEEAGFLRPHADIHAYRLSTGSLVSEFGRRGLGLEPLAAGQASALGRYQPRDPTNRQPVASYRRDTAAEQELTDLYRALRRLTSQLAHLDRMPFASSETSSAPEALPFIYSRLLTVMRRYLVQFDSSFLEVKLRLLE